MAEITKIMIKHSELIINSDGTIFHLHLKPENISGQIILVGDPARVDSIAELFEKIDFTSQNREFKTVTGWYNQKKITIIPTGNRFKFTVKRLPVGTIRKKLRLFQPELEPITSILF